MPTAKYASMSLNGGMRNRKTKLLSPKKHSSMNDGLAIINRV